MAVIGKTFSISNISIQASADTVEKKVRSLSGIRTAEVSLPSSTMYVEYSDDVIDEKSIIQAVHACGYEAHTREIPAQNEESPAEKPVLFNRNLLISAALCACLILFYFLPVSQWLAVIPVCLICFLNRKLLLNQIRELPSGHFAHSLLRLAAMAISFLYGLYTAARGNHEAVLFFFYAGVMAYAAVLEHQLIEQSRIDAASSVRDIRSSLPTVTSVLSLRHEKTARVDELKEDQILVIRPGDIIPADGRVVRGFGQINESALTGMEAPIEKGEGSYVYANSVCVKGSIEIKAEKTGSATAMMRLADLAEKTASDDSFQSPFKAFGKYLYLYILLAALITAAGWLFSGRNLSFAIMVMISVLGCASLKALGLASENEVMRSACKAMSKHVIFRSVEALEMAGKTDYAVIEQNAAVTDNEMTVTDFICAEGMSEGRLEYIAYALQSRNDRPFAKAITRYLRSRRLSAVDMEEFTRLSRLGRNALQSLSSYRAGTYDEIREQGIDTGEWEETIQKLREEGKRVLIFLRNTEIIGVIAAVRPLIPGADEAIRSMQEAGIETWLLTDGTAEESNVLEERLKPDHVLFHPGKDDVERLLAGLDEEDTITAYISPDPSAVSQEDIDITAAIGTGANPDIPPSGIMLTRNRLGDFLYAVMLSRNLNEAIASRQLSVLIYHAAAVLIFGFVLPAFIGMAFPFIAALASLAALYLIAIYKKEFPL